MEPGHKSGGCGKTRKLGKGAQPDKNVCRVGFSKDAAVFPERRLSSVALNLIADLVRTRVKSLFLSSHSNTGPPPRAIVTGKCLAIGAPRQPFRLFDPAL